MKRDDNGIAVVMITFILFGFLLIVPLVKFGIFFLECARVQNAADASALSTAQAIAHFEDEPCRYAKMTADQNNVRLVSCEIDDSYALVAVVSSQDKRIKANARAQVGE